MKRDISVVGIDIAKRVFHLVGMDKRGKIVMRKRCGRGEVLPWMANLGRTTIGMEACGGAHYWARCLREQGHDKPRHNLLSTSGSLSRLDFPGANPLS